MFQDLLSNHVLWISLIAWGLAQFLKPFLEYLETRRWVWGLWFSSGGMPSSHSALIVSAMVAIGLFEGFNTPLFALAVAMAMIVVYDAAGVRREAGKHAERINLLIEEFLAGHPISEQELKEVIGHTPGEVVAGVVLGILCALIGFGIWG